MLISGMMESGIKAPQRPLQEICRILQEIDPDSSNSELKAEGFISISMESFSNPGKNEDSKINIDASIDQSYMYNYRKIKIEQEARYRLSYSRISSFIKEQDELTLSTNLGFGNRNSAFAGLNSELETGILKSYTQNVLTNANQLQNAFLSPGTFHSGVGALLKFEKIQIDLTIPDVKLSMILNDEVLESTNRDLMNGMMAGTYKLETGYRIGFVAKHVWSSGIDIKLRCKIFTANEEFKKPELNLDQEIGIKFNKFMRTGIQTRLSYDGVRDPITRIRNMVKVGFYF